MHIAFNAWFWDQPNTGSGQYLRRLVHHLRRVSPDLQMTLILPPHNTTPDDLPQNVSILTTTGPGGKFGKVWFEQRIYPKMVKQCGADIAHVPYWAPPLSSPAKLVVSILDVIPVAMPEYAQGFFNRLYVSLVSAGAVGTAHTITISHAAKADIIKYLSIPADEITVTHLGVDQQYHPRMGAEKDEAVRKKYNLPELPFVLYLGGFDVRKQVNQLLLAYSYVSQAEGENLPLVLAGKEPAWGTSVFPDLHKYAEELKITDYIQWTGFIDDADKPSVYRLASVFVFPSQYEGFGLMLLEAMASGTPVIANDIDVFREIVDEGAYLVSDARKMAGAILALANQETFRQTMVNQGLAQATKFSWRKTAQETLAVYEQVMAKSMPG